jgi:hypothetical protein
MSHKLPFNKLFTLDLPKGEITERGKKRLIEYVLDRCNCRLPDDDFEWVMTAKKGGKITKRISKYLHDIHSHDLTDKDLEKIGNIAAQNTYSDDAIQLDFTKNFDWRAGDFDDEGSCFWGCRSGAKDMIHEGDGFAIRSFFVPKKDEDEDEDGNDAYSSSSRWYNGHVGTGRAWVIPHRDAPDTYFVFNGYGHEARTFAMVLARYLGKTFEFDCVYRYVKLCNYGSQGDLLYINSNGYAVGPKLVVDAIERYDFELNQPEVICTECGDSCDPDHAMQADDGDWYCDHCARCCADCDRVVPDCDAITVGEDRVICERCYGRHYFTCNKCNEVYHDNNGTEIDGHVYCEVCADEFPSCDECGTKTDKDNMTPVEGDLLCDDCLVEKAVACWDCGEYVYLRSCVAVEGDTLCQECADGSAIQCAHCDKWFYDENLTTHGNFKLCDSCLDKAVAEKEAVNETTHA